jgi:uncharacterized protein YndB with AHSA1/START domain
MHGSVVSTERVIAAPPEAIFDLVADAYRHPDIDGSGNVKQVKAGSPERLSQGSTFGMSMHMGIGYSMFNTVIEFEENRRIAWQTRPRGFVGKFVGGRIWRYDLEPVEGGTRVRETWDISEDHQRALLRLGKMAEQTRGSMDRTLDRIEELTATPDRP